MPLLSVLIKPASSDCNLRCKYCFYHSISETRNQKSYGMMTLDTLEVIVRKALEYSDVECTFMFQGGEPTLVGLEFYKKLIEFQHKYNTKKIRINNAIQTNGMVIDEEWAKFFHQYNFLVGISLDGPKDINDINRVNLADKSSFNRVMKTIHLFNKYRVEYNVLFVISGYAAKYAQKIYNFFKKNGFKYLQFIPCLDPLDEIPGKNLYSLTPDKFAMFLKNIFDLWYNDILKGELTSIRYFDNLLSMLMGYPPESCTMSGQCACQFVTEADGSMYPCDFYVIDNWCLGNIVNSDFHEIKNSDIAKQFIETSKHVDKQCRECKWFNLCRGGCRRNKEPFIESESSENYFCTAYKEFFDYSYERLYKVALMLSHK